MKSDNPGWPKVSPLLHAFRRLPLVFHACYTFAAPQDGFDAFTRRSGGNTVVESWIYRVLNSAAAGRRLGLRVVAMQAVATLLTALTCLTIGPRAALAALAGGGAMTLGSLAAAWGAFGGGVVGGGMALGRLLLGTAVKWLVVAAGLYLAMAVWRLPAVPALAGAAMAATAFMFAARRGTTRTNA